MSDYISREAMSKTPKCPYCGGDMVYQFDSSLINTEKIIYRGYFCCPNCHSRAPVVSELSELATIEEVEDEAYLMATTRVEPKNHVLTLEELDAHCEGGADATPLWVEFDGGANGWVLIAPVRETCKMDFVSKLLATMGILYGKEWRCWLRKPTEAERRETPWES